MTLKEVHLQVDDIKEILFRHGNKINNQEAQLKTFGDKVDLLNEHREKHSNDIIIIQARQAQDIEAIKELTKTIKDLTTKITALFTIKNMVLGGFLTLSTVFVLFSWALNLILDHYK